MNLDTNSAENFSDHLIIEDDLQSGIDIREGRGWIEDQDNLFEEATFLVKCSELGNLSAKMEARLKHLENFFQEGSGVYYEPKNQA